MTKLTIESINAQLKAANVRVRISKISGDRSTLTLRATLPPKPGSDRDKPYQQRISLNTYDTESGLKYAKAEALKLAGLLDSHQFDWKSYKPELFQDKPEKIVGKPCREWIKNFEQDFFDRGDRIFTTWKDYRKAFKLLPGDQPLTLDLAKETILITEPNTKSRERATDKIVALCLFAGIENAEILRKYRGNYSTKGKQKPLIIPTYREILDCLPGFFTDEWRNAFCLQAAFGLRNHEIYHVRFDKIDKGLLIVGEQTKTGYRIVPTCHPEWVAQWRLTNILPQDLPQSDAELNEDLGRLVWKAYKRAGVPFPPYALRHRFACDCAIQGKPLSLVVRAMGHSIAVHSKIYHAFMNESDMLAGWYS